MNQQKKEIVKQAYNILSELWCSPQDVDMETVRKKVEKISRPVPANGMNNQKAFQDDGGSGRSCLFSL